MVDMRQVSSAAGHNGESQPAFARAEEPVQEEADILTPLSDLDEIAWSSSESE